jgi:hypothetical protein
VKTFSAIAVVFTLFIGTICAVTCPKTLAQKEPPCHEPDEHKETTPDTDCLTRDFAVSLKTFTDHIAIPEAVLTLTLPRYVRNAAPPSEPFVDLSAVHLRSVVLKI